MVSELYNVNVATATGPSGDFEPGIKRPSTGTKLSTEDADNSLEYIGITPYRTMDTQSGMHDHDRLNHSDGTATVLMHTVTDPESSLHKLRYGITRVGQHPARDRCSSSMSSFSAWKSNSRTSICQNHTQSRLEYWWDIVKWPIVLLLILLLFIYFLFVEMEINESFLVKERARDSKRLPNEMEFQDNNLGWFNETDADPHNNKFDDTINITHPEQRLMSSQPTSSPTTTTTTEKPLPTQSVIGFTSGHQNNFGVPIEEDARKLSQLNDELFRLHNGTTTPRASPTTTDKYRARVSPTLPLRRAPEATTEQLNLTRIEDENSCVSTSLPLCRGVLHFDLTTSTNPQMTAEETVLFKYLLDTGCSPRVAQFMCSLFEPECRPAMAADVLPPCKRFCKSILEPCSQAVANSELLTELFDCDIYPESHDPLVCTDPTRYRACLRNEFQCGDSTCIPRAWRCDNIKDCASGDDEDNCKFCEHDEFKCRSNDKCIPEGWRCDQFKDCPGGEDELDCIDDDSRSFPFGYGATGREYSFVQEVLPNADSAPRTYQRLNKDLRQERLGSDLEHATSNVVGHVVATKSLAHFQDSTEIMMTSGSENRATAHLSPCPEGELRCISGRCITVSQLCDQVQDCDDGSDESFCETNTGDEITPSLNVTTPST